MAIVVKLKNSDTEFHLINFTESNNPNKPYNIKKQLKMLNSVNMINIFVDMINKLRRNSQTEV